MKVMKKEGMMMKMMMNGTTDKCIPYCIIFHSGTMDFKVRLIRLDLGLDSVCSAEDPCSTADFYLTVNAGTMPLNVNCAVVRIFSTMD